MKAFAVYSEDKALLRAFEEKLNDKDFVKTNNLPGDFLCIYGADKSFVTTNHDCNLTVFNLPKQWNEAVKALEELTQPRFKVGDWVVLKESNKTGRIKEIKSDEIKTDKYTLHFYKTPCEGLRHATKEEIKQELIRRSGLKVGDEVYSTMGTSLKGETIKIEEFVLIDDYKNNEGEHGSISCNEYYSKHGTHLAIAGQYQLLPVDLVKKAENDIDFEIETTEGTFKPEIKDGQVKVGCVSWDRSNIKFLYMFALWCEEQEIFVSTNNKGEITELRTNSGDVKQKITSEQIGKIVQKLAEK